MSSHSFTVSDPQFSAIEGFLIEVNVMNHVGFLINIKRLEIWSAGIADDFVAGRISRINLIEDSIGIRILTPSHRVIIDTL